MAAAFIAKICSRLICPTPLYHTMAQNFIKGPALLSDPEEYKLAVASDSSPTEPDQGTTKDDHHD